MRLRVDGTEERLSWRVEQGERREGTKIKTQKLLPQINNALIQGLCQLIGQPQSAPLMPDLRDQTFREIDNELRPLHT
jgi:hypothetical protein